MDIKPETLARLSDLRESVHAELDIDSLLIEINKQALGILEVERCTVYATDDEFMGLELYSKVLTVDDVEEIRLPVDESSLAGYVALTGKKLNVEDVNDADKLKLIHPKLAFDATWTEGTGFKPRSMLAAPIKFREKVIGVLQAMNHVDGPFSTIHIRLIDECCKYLSTALKNAKETTRLKKELNRKRTLGQILVDQGSITAPRMKDAQEEARATGRPLKEVLLRAYELPEEEYAKALAIRFNHTYFRFKPDLQLDRELVKHVPEKVAHKHLVAPLRLIRYNGAPALRVVMTDPGADYVLDEIERRTRMRVREVVIGSSVSLKQLIETLYGEPDEEALVLEPEEEPEPAPANEEEVLAGVDDWGTDTEQLEVGSEMRREAGPIVKLVNYIINRAYKEDASDIHIEPYDEEVLVRFRKDGTLQKVFKFHARAGRAVVSRIKVMANLDPTKRLRPQDGKINFKKFGGPAIELRVGIIRTAGDEVREDVVMRLLASSDPIPLKKMGMCPYVFDNIVDQIERPYGLIFVVGPTGSGKTTTLHSCLGHINKPERKILTVEDPVEITQIGLRQIQIDRATGMDFKTVLRQFLRQDPDVIMVGECRDQETAGVAVESALTGHVVFSTLHTNNAPETITRLLELDLDPYSFADALLCVLAQRLARTSCKVCKEPWRPTPQEWSAMRLDPRPGARMTRAPGCEHCNKGYRGRMGIHELLLNKSNIRDLITRKAPMADIRVNALANGMLSLYDDGVEKVYQGLTTIDEVRRVCVQKQD